MSEAKDYMVRYGYLSPEESGEEEGAMTAALRKFQKKMGITVTGERNKNFTIRVYGFIVCVLGL